MKRRYESVYIFLVSNFKLTFPKTKSPIRIAKRSTKLLAEVLYIFVAEKGVVLDAYGGTVTMAIACIQSGRKCYSL